MDMIRSEDIMEIKVGDYFQDPDSDMVYLVSAVTKQMIVFAYAARDRFDDLAKGHAMETTCPKEEFIEKYEPYVDKAKLPAKLILHSHIIRKEDGTFYQTGWKSVIDLKDYEGESVHVIKKEIILG